MHGCWPPAIGFVYFLAILTVIAWLPRHSIPGRLFSYIMVAACLAGLAKALQRGREIMREHDPAEGAH